MIRKYIPLLLATISVVGFSLLSSCSSANLESMAESDSTAHSEVTISTPVLDSLSHLPVCESASKGLLYFVLQDSSFQYCSGTVYRGFDLGTAGIAGSSCSVTSNSDNTNTITCTDGTTVVVKDGATGATGAAGAVGAVGLTGAPCTLSDDGHGTLSIQCGETSSSWAKALCGMSQMLVKITATPSLTRMSIPSPSFDSPTMPYDPATERCKMGAVVRKCVDRDGEDVWYYPHGDFWLDRAPQFCDARDGEIYEIAVMDEQAWMRQDLRYEGENGDVGEPYYNANTSSDSRYYDWSEATTEACPAGWALPNTDSVSVLDGYLEELATADSYTYARHTYLKSYSWSGSSNDWDGDTFATEPNGQLQLDAVDNTTWDIFEFNAKAYYWLTNSVDATNANALIINNTNYRNGDPTDTDVSLLVGPVLKAYRNTVRCVRQTPPTAGEISFWINASSRK